MHLIYCKSHWQKQPEFEILAIVSSFHECECEMKRQLSYSEFCESKNSRGNEIILARSSIHVSHVGNGLPMTSQLHELMLCVACIVDVHCRVWIESWARMIWRLKWTPIKEKKMFTRHSYSHFIIVPWTEFDRSRCESDINCVRDSSASGVVHVYLEVAFNYNYIHIFCD